MRADVSIDGKALGQTNFIGRDYLIDSLRPGFHTVTLSKDGYQKLQKKIAVDSQVVTEVNPFLVPDSPSIIEITKTIADTSLSKLKAEQNPAWKAVDAIFNPADNQALETATVDPASLVSADGKKKEGYIVRQKMALFRIDTTLYAEWLGTNDYLPPFFCKKSVCTDLIEVFTGISDKTYYDFYPGRNDIMLIALKGGIYAVELDTRGGQNKMLVYGGNDLSFRVQDGETLYVKKDNSTFVDVATE